MRALAAFVLMGILVASTVGGAKPHDEAWSWGHRQTFGPWSRPVNLGPIVNSTAHDQTPVISRDGLSLYLSSDRPGGSGGFDIWVSQRLATDLPWETPVNLGPTVNTPANDNGPSLSPDGRQLFFISNRPGGAGLADLYMSRRIRSDAGYVWGTPVNLSSLNTSGIDAAPHYFDGPGLPQLYFTSTRLGGPEDIHVSELQKDGVWGTPVPVVELNSPAPDGRATVRSDGLEIIFDSSRDGGQTDLYVSLRDYVWQPWSIPEKVAGAVNTVGFDARPSLSHDGRTLYFTFQTAEGHLDLLVSTRAVLRDRHHGT